MLQGLRDAICELGREEQQVLMESVSPLPMRMHVETCILSYVNQIISPGSMHETGCSGLVHWDGPEGWDGEGGVRGDSGWGTHVHPWQIHVKYGKNHCSTVK